MKKLSVALLLLIVCASASAASVDVAALRSYAKSAISRCPDAVVSLEPILQQGPMNFLVYDVKVTSKDENCKTRKILLYSPSTQQVILGTVFALPDDGRPLQARLTEHASKLLQEPVTASIAGFPLPDGIKAISLTKSTRFGPFSYHGYVDASERFMLIGMRGNLRTPATTTLRDAIAADTVAARRGTRKAKVEILELSDFECPTCAKAHEKIDPLIEKNLNKVNFGRIDLPLFEHHEYALPAAVAGRAILKVAPAKYWEYVDFMFRNQEQIGKMNIDKVVQDFCEDHDISWAKVKPIYLSQAERQAMLEQVSRAFDNNINATPTFLINGQMVEYGPDGATVLKAIKAALGAK